MSKSLTDRKVAILVADGFEQREMLDSKRALDAAGARTSMVSLEPGRVRGWEYDHFGESFPVDIMVNAATAEDFDALLVPGAVMNPGALRGSADAVEFVRGFFRAHKPVAAACHGLQSLLEAGVVRDRTVTSFPSGRTALINAGAYWVDAAVVVDHGLVTGRSPADREDFISRMITEFAESRHPNNRKWADGGEARARASSAIR